MLPSSPAACTALSMRLRSTLVNASGSPTTIAGPLWAIEMDAGVRGRVSVTTDFADLREVDGLAAQRLVGLEASEIEQVVDEPPQPLGTARDLGLELISPRARRLLAQQRLDRRLQRRDRRAQLVGGVGEEPAHRRL